MITIDKHVVEVLETMEEAGIESFLVGGYIRDLLLNKKSFDVDICYSGSTDVLCRLFEQDSIDKSGLAYHSITFTKGEFQFECTHFRTEENYQDHRHPLDVSLTRSLVEDLKRRDFTMNAICYHLHTGLIDHYNGISDLEEGIIRSVGVPKVKLKEDLLRVFRAIRFQSQLGFNIDEETQSAMDQLMPQLRSYPVQWWQKEFEKMLLGNHFHEMSMIQHKFFSSLFEGFEDAYQWDQRNPYHQYTLYEHTMRVVAYAPMDIRLKYAALFHDFGKLHTEIHDEHGVSHYPNHALVSAEYALPILEQFQLKKADRDYILKLIKYHGVRMAPGFKTVYEMVVEHGFEFTEDLIKLKRADNMSKSDKAFYQVAKCDVFLSDIERIKNEHWPVKIADLQVDGHDCLALNVPDKLINQVLSQVLDQVVENLVGNHKEQQVVILKEVIRHVIH